MTDADLFYGNPTNGPLGVTFKVETARVIGGYRSVAGAGADWDLLVRLSQVGKLYLLKKNIGRYRYDVNETLNEGVIESFLQTGPITRSELINSDVSVLRRKLFRLADKLQNKLQAKRYNLLIQSNNTTAKKTSDFCSIPLAKIFMMRVCLKCIVTVFSHVR